jgi:hypothetical protein
MLKNTIHPCDNVSLTSSSVAYLRDNQAYLSDKCLFTAQKPLLSLTVLGDAVIVSTSDKVLVYLNSRLIKEISISGCYFVAVNDENRLLACCAGHLLYCVHMDSDQLTILQGHTHPILSCAFYSSSIIFTISEDKTFKGSSFISMS